jgi:hypothetical protein
MKRGPVPLAIVALCVLLLGVAYVTVEFIQRTRFDNRRLNVESLMLGIQGRLRFQLDKNGSIHIPDVAQSGAQPVVEPWSNESMGSRIMTWTLTFPVGDPNVPGGVVQRRVMHLSLIQQRVGFLRNPLIAIKDTWDCDPGTIETLRMRVFNQDLGDIAQFGF